MRGRKLGFTLVELLIVILIIGILAAVLIPAVIWAMRSSRQSNAELLVRTTLPMAIKSYEGAKGGYPPGTGTGSAGLSAALLSPGPRLEPYLERTAVKVDPQGNILNPIDEVDILHYRNNRLVKGAAGAHNVTSYDLWCKDIHGSVEGVNNW